MNYYNSKDQSGEYNGVYFKAEYYGDGYGWQILHFDDYRENPAMADDILDFLNTLEVPISTDEDLECQE